MKYFFMVAIMLISLISCVFHPRGGAVLSKGPFIDSTGYKTAQKRISLTGWEESTTLISQALSVMGDSLQADRQADFFESIEENYQRYLKLFTLTKEGIHPEIKCDYDLPETFKLGIFDTQPFINALLHTMALTEVTTLDFSLKPQSADTTLLLVKVSRAVYPDNPQSLTFLDGDVTVSVARHTAVLVGMKME